MGEDTKPLTPRWRRKEESEGRAYQIKDPADVNRRREEAGLSHSVLAARAGCSKSMAGFVCAGDRTGLSEVLVMGFARALGCLGSDLVEDWPAELDAQLEAEPVRA